MSDRKGGEAAWAVKKETGSERRGAGLTLSYLPLNPLESLSWLEHMVRPRALRHSSGADSTPPPQLGKQVGASGSRPGAWPDFLTQADCARPARTPSTPSTTAQVWGKNHTSHDEVLT